MSGTGRSITGLSRVVSELAVQRNAATVWDHAAPASAASVIRGLLAVSRSIYRPERERLGVLAIAIEIEKQPG
jgi:hypothetical protein